jgi:hypothetical protein
VARADRLVDLVEQLSFGAVVVTLAVGIG